jgi:hypothetical protein
MIHFLLYSLVGGWKSQCQVRILVFAKELATMLNKMTANSWLDAGCMVSDKTYAITLALALVFLDEDVSALERRSGTLNTDSSGIINRTPPDLGGVL